MYEHVYVHMRVGEGDLTRLTCVRFLCSSSGVHFSLRQVISAVDQALILGGYV